MIARFLLAATCLAVFGASAHGQTVSSDEQQLRTLLAEYAQSVDSLDLSLADRIWSHDGDVVFIHPRGTEIGFAQIIENFYKKTMGMLSERELVLENPVVHVYGDAGWSEMTWTFHATVKETGQKITTTGRETQIYHRENGVWRIVHVHYSGPPVTGALKGL